MSDAFNKAKEIIDPALSAFGGEDGGVGFFHIKNNLTKCIERAEEGDATAQNLLEQFQRMNRLVQAFSQPINWEI